MKLVFLGTAGAVPLRTRNYSALFFEHDTVKGLFDCGEGTSRQLLNAELALDKIEHIYLTHTHLDHILGVPNILLYKYVNNRESPTTINLPKEGTPILDGVLRTIPDRILKKMNLKVRGLSLGNTHDLKGNMGISWAKTDHDPEKVYASVAYRIDTSSKTLVYTGDTKPCPPVEGIAKDVDLLITEASFPDNLQDTAASTGHMTPIQAAKLAVKSNVKKLVLTHLTWEESEEPSNLLKQAHEVFKGPIEIAHDMMQIIL